MLAREMAGIAAIFGRCRDDPAAANRATPLLNLRWTFPAKRASVVVTDSEPDRLAPLPPPAPRGPPRGLGGGGAMLCRHDREEFWHVQAQTRANCKGAGFIQGAAEGSPQRRPAHQADEFEAGAGAGTAAPTGRRHHYDDHDIHRLATALGG